jgi:hypothetical protein
MSATSMSTATRVEFCRSTNVRMVVTPSGPKTSSRFGDASQWSVSLTSWWAMMVGIGVLLRVDVSGPTFGENADRVPASQETSQRW